MARELIANCQCPECGHTDAEVKRAKSGLLYRWCPDCTAQYFPRSAAMSDRLARAAGIGVEPVATPVTGPAKVVEPERKRGFDMGGL